MKKTLATSVVAALSVLLLAACGSTSSTGSDGSTSGADARTISGTLTGDLTYIKGVSATSLSDGSKYNATLTTARSNALVSSSANFSMSVPTNNAYQIHLESSDDPAAATVQFPTSTTGGTTSTSLSISTGNSAVNLGNINVPANTGAPGVGSTTVDPGINPLTENDQDHDGVNDLEDDNDGVYDNDHNGNDHNGNDGSNDSGDSNDHNGNDGSNDSGDSNDHNGNDGH